VDEYDYSNDNLNGLYTEFLEEDYAGLIVERSLPDEVREALEAEAECYQIKGPRARRKFCYAPRSYEDMDRERIRALKRCIEQIRPDWVEQVRMATLMDNEVYTIVHLSGVPPYPAVAILENMKGRGELAQG